MHFRDRTEAGRALASQLTQYAGRQDTLVLALPRGGVPVAFEVAEALNAALDVFLVRKLGVPGQEELAMGAIASGGVRVMNQAVIHALGISASQIETVAAEEERELLRREFQYRGERRLLSVTERNAILVDDGAATGSTMRAAITALRLQHPAKIIVAIPVAAPSTRQELQKEADEMLCLYTPDSFFAVGQWYSEFPQTSDEQVRELLGRAAHRSQRGA